MQLEFPVIISILSVLGTIVTVVTSYNYMKFKIEALEAKVKSIESQTIIGLNDQIQTLYKELRNISDSLNEMKIEFAQINAKFQYKTSKE